MFAGFGLGRGPPIGIVRERPRVSLLEVRFRFGSPGESS